MKKLLLWKERCDAEGETKNKSTAMRGQERPGKSMKVLLEKLRGAKKTTKTKTKTSMTVKERIAKVLKNKKAENTRAHRLFFPH